MTTRKKPEDLRSHRWFGVQDLRSFGHRSRLRQIGYDAEDWGGKPVIGIINTWSDINACHAHLRSRAEDVKRGVLQAGGFPLELPAISLAEPFVKPTTMLYRNFLAMETEELLRSHPDRRCGAARRLRQDHAWPDHGRDLHGAAGDLLPGRPHAARQLARADLGFGLGRVEILGREARRQDQRGRLGGNGRRHCAVLRHLHDHGHGRHHDGHRRGAGSDPAGGLGAAGSRCRASAHVRPGGAAHRRHGVGKPDARPDRDSRCRRERHYGAHGDGRFHQRHHPRGRYGAPCRHRVVAGAVRSDLAQGAGDRQRAAVGRASDGGLLLRGRAAGADEGAGGAAASAMP